MTWSAHEREAASAIEALAPGAEANGPSWRFRLARQAGAPSIAGQVEGSWLMLDAVLGTDDPPVSVAKGEQPGEHPPERLEDLLPDGGRGGGLGWGHRVRAGFAARVRG